MSTPTRACEDASSDHAVGLVRPRVRPRLLPTGLPRRDCRCKPRPGGHGADRFGKTAVALAAILQARRGRTAVYTSPIKAPSTKFWGWGLVLAPLPDGVRLLVTGDIRIHAPPEATHRLVVCTSEILRNQLFEIGKGARDDDETHSICDLCCLVSDEVHYITDRERGGVWEALMNLPSTARSWLSPRR